MQWNRRSRNAEARRRRRVVGFGTGAGAVLAFGMGPLAAAPRHQEHAGVVIPPTAGGWRMGGRWFDLDRHSALTEGAIWDRKTARHESAVEIIKCVTSRIGTRYLVQGLESGRQRFINHSTLLRSYEPRRISPPL
jgi:hypothetical protein